ASRHRPEAHLGGGRRPARAARGGFLPPGAGRGGEGRSSRGRHPRGIARRPRVRPAGGVVGGRHPVDRRGHHARAASREEGGTAASAGGSTDRSIGGGAGIRRHSPSRRRPSPLPPGTRRADQLGCPPGRSVGGAMMGAPTVALRAMTAADVDSAHALEQRVYPQAWSRQVFVEELAQPNRHYAVAEIGGDFAGYGGVMVVGDEAHTTTVVVAPEHRQSRVGTRLMLELVERALESGAEALTLEVRVSNEAAQALYRRFGMAPVGVRKAYYVDEDALIMWAHEIDSDEYAQRLDAIAAELGE